jgi:release factor glutamine methyltransferase
MGRSIAQLILDAASVLRKSGVPESRLDAGALLAHVLQCDRTFIISHADDLISESLIDEFQGLVNRRSQGEPLQYITGHQEFFGLDFEVSDAVLIPRPETELLVETAIELLRNIDGPALICDVGTGSGCVAISLLHQVELARAMAIDVSEQALEVAKKNARKHNIIDRMSFVLSDCLEAIVSGSLFDLVVSNPPYVAEAAMAGLQREVREFEPRISLTPGGDGLSLIKRLIATTPQVLKPGGYLLLEIGFDQQERVKQMIDPKTWRLLDVHKDLQGIPRTVALLKV